MVFGGLGAGFMRMVMAMNFVHSVSKSFTFEMAHRLKCKEGSFYPKEKCGSLHGHSVRTTVILELESGAELDRYGFVTDFGDFKPVKTWIDATLDHATIAGSNDHDLIEFLRGQGDRMIVLENGPASAENIAAMIFRHAQKLLGSSRVRVTEVRVSETCTNEACVRLQR